MSARSQKFVRELNLSDSAWLSLKLITNNTPLDEHSVRHRKQNMTFIEPIHSARQLSTLVKIVTDGHTLVRYSLSSTQLTKLSAVTRGLFVQVKVTQLSN